MSGDTQISKVAGIVREGLKSPTVIIILALAGTLACSIFFDSYKLPFFCSLSKPEGISVACKQKTTE